MAKHIYKDGKYTGEEHLSDEEHNRRRRENRREPNSPAANAAGIIVVVMFLTLYFIWYCFFRDAPDVSQFLPHDFYD